MALVFWHPKQKVVTIPHPISTNIFPISTNISPITTQFLAHSLHIVSTSPVRLLLELHGSLGVGYGAVLLVPVVVLHQGWDTVGVHQDVAAKERCLDNRWITVEGGLDSKRMKRKDAWITKG